jgi:hypothetical protein
MIDVTSKQIAAIHARTHARCTNIRIERASPTATVRAVEVSFFERQRLIETVRIQPGGAVKVLS